MPACSGRQPLTTYYEPDSGTGGSRAASRFIHVGLPVHVLQDACGSPVVPQEMPVCSPCDTRRVPQQNWRYLSRLQVHTRRPASTCAAGCLWFTRGAARDARVFGSAAVDNILRVRQIAEAAVAEPPPGSYKWSRPASTCSPGLVGLPVHSLRGCCLHSVSPPDGRISCAWAGVRAVAVSDVQGDHREAQWGAREAKAGAWGVGDRPAPQPAGRREPPNPDILVMIPTRPLCSNQILVV